MPRRMLFETHLLKRKKLDLAVALFDLITVFLFTQTKAQNIPLYFLFRLQYFFLSKSFFFLPFISPCPLSPRKSALTDPLHNSPHRALPHRHNTHHATPQPNRLLRARQQQLHLLHRPLQLVQRHIRVQRRCRWRPRFPIQMGRSRLLVYRRHAPAMRARPPAAPHQHV